MGRSNFRYIPHTADVAFVAYGKTFKEAVENSASALFNTMFDIKKLKKSKTRIKMLRITETATNQNDIAWFVLQKIVSKVDEKGVQAIRFKVNRILETKNKIKINGCIFYKKSKEYISLLDVKAVTPSEFRVQKSGRKWSIKAILDV